MEAQVLLPTLAMKLAIHLVGCVLIVACSTGTDQNGANPAPKECETLDANVEVDASDGSDDTGLGGGDGGVPTPGSPVVAKLHCITVLEEPGDPSPTPEFVLERDANGNYDASFTSDSTSAPLQQIMAGLSCVFLQVVTCSFANGSPGSPSTSNHCEVALPGEVGWGSPTSHSPLFECSGLATGGMPMSLASALEPSISMGIDGVRIRTQSYRVVGGGADPNVPGVEQGILVQGFQFASACVATPL